MRMYVTPRSGRPRPYAAPCSAERRRVVQVLHSCIVNLVIGTLYCAKQNYDFGLGRVIKALEPLEATLEADTWFYAKRCIVALVDGMAKHMVFLADSTVADVLAFLEGAEGAGAEMPAATAAGPQKAGRMIAEEARDLATALRAHCELCVAGG